MVRIRKQYKQPDGTLIEVEGTESEIEAFEKKQQKQKVSNEQAEKKRTILYGKDALEEFRKIVREEIAAAPPRIEYRYLPYPYYPHTYWVNPWVQPLLPQPLITWTIGQNTNGIAGQTVTCTGATGSGGTAWYQTNNTNEPVGVFNSSNAVVDLMLKSSNKIGSGTFETGQDWRTALNGTVSGWNGHASAAGNYLMSPRM